MQKKNVILKDELIDRGYDHSVQIVDGHKYHQYFRNGRHVITKAGYYDYPFVSPTAKRVSKNKMLSYAYAHNEGLHTAATLRSSDESATRRFLEEYGRIIVKPSSLGGGVGLTTNITTTEKLEAAIEKARRLGADPILQEQFDGTVELRVTVINGRVASVLCCEPAVVYGDGSSTLTELIGRENEARQSLVFATLAYPQLDTTLIDESFMTSTRIPEDGERVALSTVAAIYKGASYYGVTERVHDSFKQISENLANKLNPPFLVVDFMVKDATLAAKDDNYIFLELTTSPAIYLYTSLRGGDDQQHVVTDIADLVDTYANTFCHS